MAKSASSKKHLKLYTEQPPKPQRPPIEAISALPDLMRAFQAATGWKLRYQSTTPSALPGGEKKWSAPVAGGPSLAKGQIVLEPAEQKADKVASEEKRVDSGQWVVGSDNQQSSIIHQQFPNPPSIPSDSAKKLAGSIADLLSELLETRQALWHREAELAAGVPLVPHREEEKNLATRLEAVLKAGAEAVAGDAVALYLLDEATTELKMRSSWGLPFDRLVAPARPLEGALADLEAMLGHAVVLNDEQVIRAWNMPENFPTAVCVPVSTSTTLLGTLWVFCNRKRDFNDRETNLLEVVAGRIASDLEREMLLRSGIDGVMLQKQIAAAERLQRNTLPTISPLLDGWNIAGWSSQAEGVGGSFHDWFCLPRGLLAVASGKAAQQGVVGALTASAVKTAVRAHARYHRHAERILQQTNLTLWTGSAGDQHSTLFCGLIETATGRVCCSSAGKISLLRLGAEGWQSLSQDAPVLGSSAESDFEQFGHELQPGETLVIFSDTLSNITDNQQQPLTESRLGEVLCDKRHLSAEELVAVIRSYLETHGVAMERQDLSILVVRRTTA